MIIVSQNKDKILNFNLICNMFVFDGEIRCVFADGSDTIIGVYETRERAKEVLKDIIDYYRQGFKIYYMSKK